MVEKVGDKEMMEGVRDEMVEEGGLVEERDGREWWRKREIRIKRGGRKGEIRRWWRESGLGEGMVEELGDRRWWRE